MALVQQKMSQTRLSTEQVALYLQDQFEATEIVESPPRYVVDLLTHLKQQDEDGWTRVGANGKKRNSDGEEPRTFLSLWLKGEDLNLFASLSIPKAQTTSEEPSISVSVDPKFAPSATPPLHQSPSTRAPKPKSGSEQSLSHEAYQQFHNRFAFLGEDAPDVSATRIQYSDLDDDIRDAMALSAGADDGDSLSVSITTAWRSTVSPKFLSSPTHRHLTTYRISG